MPANADEIPWDVMASAYVLARRVVNFAGWEHVAATWPSDRYGDRSSGAIKAHYSRLTKGTYGQRWVERGQAAREVLLWNTPPSWFLMGGRTAEEWFVWAVDTNTPRLVRPS